MKTALYALLITLGLLTPTISSAQVFNQSQLIITPYNGVIFSTSTLTGAKLSASSSPYFSQLLFGSATGTQATTTSLFSTKGTFDTLCLSADICRTTWPSSGGGGSGNVATSSQETATRVPFWTSTNATPATLSGGSSLFTFASGSGLLTISSLFSTFATTTNFLATGSSTLQNFTFINATGTQATTTNFYSSIGTFGGLFAPTRSTGDSTTNAATTAFVTTAINNAIAGVNPAVAVQAATTAAGDTSGLTYNNGASGIGAFFTGSNNTAITVDGYTFTALGQRLLVKNDTQSPSGAFNGVYYVTQVQTAILPPILTRALDYDMPSDINNTGAIPVVNGTVNANTSWLLTSSVTTVGTDPLTYVQFSVNPTTIVTTSRNINTTYPVLGGGSLAADRTISLDFGTTTNNLWSGTNIWQNASNTIVGNLTIGGNATATNATTTNHFATTASSTNIFGGGLFTCNGANQATNYNGAGRFGCVTFSSGGTPNSKLATSTNTYLSLNPNGGNNVGLGIGTSTPAWALQIASSTAAQLTLSDPATATNFHWSFRNAGGQLFLATSTNGLGYATSTTSILSIDANGILKLTSGLLVPASTTIGDGSQLGGLTVNGMATTSNLLVTGSTTLQNFTAKLATTTQATTTQFSASIASTTNLRVDALGGTGVKCVQAAADGLFTKATGACAVINSFGTTTLGNMATVTIPVANLPVGNQISCWLTAPRLVGNATTTLGSLFMSFNTPTDPAFSPLYGAGNTSFSAAGTNSIRVNNGASGAGAAIPFLIESVQFTIDNRAGTATHNGQILTQMYSTSTSNGATVRMDNRVDGQISWASSSPISQIDFYFAGRADQAAFATSTEFYCEAH